MTAKARLFSYHWNCRNGTFSFAIEIRFQLFFMSATNTKHCCRLYNEHYTLVDCQVFWSTLLFFLSLDRFSNSSRSLTFEHFVQLGEQICLNKHWNCQVCKAGFRGFFPKFTYFSWVPPMKPARNYSSYFEMNLLNFEVTDRKLKINIFKNITWILELHVNEIIFCIKLTEFLLWK